MSPRFARGGRFLVSSLMLVAIAACGDDGGGTPIDGRLADGPTIDGAETDGPTTDAPIVDAPDVDGAAIDAPTIDGAAIDAPAIDGGSIDASIDARLIDAMVIDAPTDAATDAAVPVDGATNLPGDICQSAEAITLVSGSATVPSSTFQYTNNYQPACAGVSSGGPDRVHSVVVNNNQRLTAAVVPTTGTFDPGIYLVGGPAANCDAAPIVCLGSNDTGGDGATDQVIYNNTSGSSVTVFILIDGFRVAGDAYTLNVNVGAIPPIPPGDTCQLAEPVTLVSGMATIVATTAPASGYNNNYAPPNSCTGYPEVGNDRVHLVHVLAGQRLTATVTPTASTFDVSVYFVAVPPTMCDASPIACLGGTDVRGRGGADTAVYENTSGIAVDVQVVVDSYYTGGDGYVLGIRVGATPAGETCSLPDPITLSGGTATVNATTIGYLNNHDPSDYPTSTTCTEYYTDGPDRLHTVTVPGLQTLTATVTPETDYDPGIYLIAAPAANCAPVPAVCLDGLDMGGPGDPETVSYTNPTNAPVDVFIGIDGYSDPSFSFPDGTYTLVVTAAP